MQVILGRQSLSFPRTTYSTGRRMAPARGCSPRRRGSPAGPSWRESAPKPRPTRVISWSALHWSMHRSDRTSCRRASPLQVTASGLQHQSGFVQSAAGLLSPDSCERVATKKWARKGGYATSPFSGTLIWRSVRSLDHPGADIVAVTNRPNPPWKVVAREIVVHCTCAAVPRKVVVNNDPPFVDDEPG